MLKIHIRRLCDDATLCHDPKAEQDFVYVESSPYMAMVDDEKSCSKCLAVLKSWFEDPKPPTSITVELKER